MQKKEGMEKTNKQRLLDAIGWLYEKSENSKLAEAFFEQAHSHLELLSSYFGVSPVQAFLIVMVFSLDHRSGSIDINDLCRHFDCNPMKVYAMIDDVDELCRRGILLRERQRRQHRRAQPAGQYALHADVVDAILRGKPMPQTDVESFMDVISVLEKVCELGNQREEEMITSGELFEQTVALIAANQNFPLMHKILALKLNEADTFMFAYLVWRTVTGREFTDLGQTMDGIFDKYGSKARYMQSLLAGTNELITLGLVELAEAPFFNDAGLKLSSKGQSLVQESGISLSTGKRPSSGIIDPSGIMAKELIYNDEEARQLILLRELLGRDHFLRMQQKLQEKGLPGGVAVLLHGAPGTGKTETALQLARETGREVMRVDISKGKSMWFGESEKIIKKVFTDYSDFAANSTQTPILLINEADAIISKRRELGSSSVSQTENTMQNIILEELENFQGIYIATTNLVKNLDAAFERRFLFKIEMKKPDHDACARIWKLKLPFLSMQQCDLLAAQYRFSGGQIENIARKQTIHEVIYNMLPDFNQIETYCRDEMLEKSGSVRIGYLKMP